jgi:hypothetical protein
MPTPSPELYLENYVPPPVRRGAVYQAEDLTGRRFGKLLVLRRLPNAVGQVCWLTRCDCGREKRGYSRYLRGGEAKSCGGKGCLVQPPRAYRLQIQAETLTSQEHKEHITVSRVARQYRSSARIKRREFSLTGEEVRVLIFSNCHYCGAPPSNTQRLGRAGSVHYSGIDRVDNARGYASDNVVACCRTCNLMKGAKSSEAFLSHVKRILKQVDRSGKISSRVTISPSCQSPLFPPPPPPPPLL